MCFKSINHWKGNRKPVIISVWKFLTAKQEDQTISSEQNYLAYKMSVLITLTVKKDNF